MYIKQKISERKSFRGKGKRTRLKNENKEEELKTRKKIRER